MEIWEERYTDEKYGLERKASFDYFQQYLALPPNERSIKNLHEQIVSKALSKKSSKKRRIKIETLYEYSCKWKWLEREQAFRDHLAQTTSQRLAEELVKYQLEEMSIAINHSKIHSKLLLELVKDNRIPIDKKIHAANKAEQSHDIANDKVFKIANDGKVPDKKEVKADVDSNVNVQKLFNEELLDDVIAMTEELDERKTKENSE